MPTQLLYLLKVNNPEGFEISDLKKILSEKYNNLIGFGFDNLEYHDDNISCTYIYSVNLKSKVFDEVSNTVISDTRTVFYEVNFTLDLSKLIIIIKGGTDKIKRLNNSLSVITKNKLSIENIFFDINEIIRVLNENIIDFSLTGFIIKNYRPDENISGKFAAKIQNQMIVAEILETYNTDVSEFTAVGEIYNTAIKIRLSRTGALAVSGTYDAINSFIQTIKDIIEEMH